MIGYVSRCKYKNSDELHKTVHAFIDDKTFCGSALGDMWWVHGYSDDADIQMEISCRACKKVIEEEYLKIPAMNIKME